MKRRMVLGGLLALAGGGLLFPQGLTVSGILDSTLALNAGAGDAPAFSYGLEEYANVRIQAKIRDKAAFFSAVNFIAASGDFAVGGAALGLIAGQNYAAAFELERLYFRLNGEALGFDGGLLRLPFGYGQVWGPSDFLNPKNPLNPDARPRAVLGAGLSWFPLDGFKLLAFGAAPKNPLAHSGGGGLAGLSAERHWEKASVQALYAFQSPQGDSSRGLHRFGMSAKADIEIGLVTDLLYTFNPDAAANIDGLAFSLGADYSFFDGNLIVLAEYLYSGAASATSFNEINNLLGRIRENYLYTSLTWRFSDYTSASAALVSGFDDVSFTPLLSVQHDLFQGMNISFSAQVPLDRDLFSGSGEHGELGPLPPGGNIGSYCNFIAKARLRF